MTKSGGSLHGDDAPVVVPVCPWVGVEGDEQVRGHPLRSRGLRLPGNVSLAGDDGGFGVAHVLDQMVEAAAQGRVVEAGHVLRVLLRRVRQYESWFAFRLGCLGMSGGHVGPLGAGGLGSGIRFEWGFPWSGVRLMDTV